MSNAIPQSVIDRLEREWRLMEEVRESPRPEQTQNQVPERRLKIGRVD